MCTSYSFIDASTEGYEEEEVYEEEEEHFDNCTNQGKLIPCRLLPMQVILMQADILQDILMQVILVQISKSLPWQFIYWRHFTYPKFLPCKLLLLFIKAYFIVNFCLSLEYYKSIKLSLDS